MHYLVAVKQHGMIFTFEEACYIVIVVLTGRVSGLSGNQHP